MKKSRPKAPRLPLPKTNPKRKKKAHAEAYGPPGFADYIRSRGCVVAIENGSARCFGKIEVCHLKSRGAGGGWQNNVFGCCTRHHSEQHALGIETWEKRHQLDIDLWCAALTSTWEAQEYGWSTFAPEGE